MFETIKGNRKKKNKRNRLIPDTENKQLKYFGYFYRFRIDQCVKFHVERSWTRYISKVIFDAINKSDFHKAANLRQKPY